MVRHASPCSPHPLVLSCRGFSFLFLPYPAPFPNPRATNNQRPSNNNPTKRLMQYALASRSLPVTARTRTKECGPPRPFVQTAGRTTRQGTPRRRGSRPRQQNRCHREACETPFSLSPRKRRRFFFPPSIHRTSSHTPPYCRRVELLQTYPSSGETLARWSAQHKLAVAG